MKKSITNHQLIIAKLDFAQIILSRTSICDIHVTNQEFCKLLNIIDYEAQSIRHLKLIKYKRAGSIIVYSLDAVRDYVNLVYGPRNPNSNA